MKLIQPVSPGRGSGRTPIVNDSHFSDGPPAPSGPPAMPTIGSPMDTFNPGANASALPNGPPKYVQPQGKRVIAKGLTNKRITGNV